MKTYFLYYSEEESSYTFIEERNLSNNRLLSKDAKFIWKVQAKSWEIACMKKNEYLGWEPYKPMIVSEDDLKQFIPEDKFDFDNFQLLQNLGYPQIEPVLLNLFEWIQDMNWPVAQKIAPFLAELGMKSKSQIQNIFASNDGIWKYWTITNVINKMKLEDAKGFESDLITLLSNLSEDDRENEVDIAINEVLQKIQI